MVVLQNWSYLTKPILDTEPDIQHTCLQRLGADPGCTSNCCPLLHLDVSYKTPVAARVDIYILNVVFCDYDVCLIPQRKNGHIATHDVLNLAIQIFRFGAVKSVYRFIE